LCWPDTTVRIQTIITDFDKNPNIKDPSVIQKIQYRHGMMRREDSLSGGIAEIANCETKTGLLIDLDAHEYRSYNLVKFESESQRVEYLQKMGKTAVQVESKTVDTGERKIFFGHVAKHLITTTERADGNSFGGEDLVDGWYIDHELPDRYCAPDFVREEPYYVIGTTFVEYPEVAQFHHIGPLPTGLPVRIRVTSKRAATKGGTVVRTITIEKTVEELSDLPLSPSLFQLPGGFHQNPQLFRGRTPSSR
jgi:hypothetical protein